MDLALKSARIVDLCRKSSAFADFENTVDRGSAVTFDADPDCACLMLGSWVLNEIWIIDLFSAFDRMLISSFKLFTFSKEDYLNSYECCAA